MHISKIEITNATSPEIPCCALCVLSFTLHPSPSLPTHHLLYYLSYMLQHTMFIYEMSFLFKLTKMLKCEGGFRLLSRGGGWQHEEDNQFDDGKLLHF